MALAKISQALGKHTSDLSEYKLLTQGSALVYKSQKNASHALYFPILRTADGSPACYDANGVPTAVKEGEYPGAYARTFGVHTWGNGNDLTSCLCTRGYHDEDEGYDGTCPVCDRISDSNSIRELRLNKEMAVCTLSGEERTKYEEDRKNAHFHESKVSGAAEKFFSLVAVFNIVNRKPEEDTDGLPKFKLQITNFSKGTVATFEAALDGAEAENANVAGREFNVKYPDIDDAMKRMGGVKVALRNSDKLLVAPGSPLEKKIIAAVANFDFETALEASFAFLKGTPLKTVRDQMDKRFAIYDNYIARLQVDPNAEYLEYGASIPAAPPAAAPRGKGAGGGFISAGSAPVQNTVDSVDDLLSNDGDDDF